MAKGSVLNKEMRRKTQGSLSRFEVLVSENRRSQKKRREKSRSKSKSKYKNVECHYCHKIGHIHKHCFLWKNENKGKKDKSKEKSNDDDDDHVTTTIGDDLVILRDFELVNLVSNENIWIIDSGATLHVTPRKEFFTCYTSGDLRVLKMGNDSVTKVIGVRVKHAPNVRFNLIFVHMLDDGGYDNHFGYGKWKLTKDSANAMDMETSLWHQSLSHITKKGLNCLAKKDMLPGLKNIELEKCSHCMVGKQIRISFRKHPPLRKSELLELVHSDVCGPLKVKTFSGALYFITFIDDYFRKLWAYVLKTKDPSVGEALVERQSSKKVKCIHSDNSGEYYGPFYDIKHEKTLPKTPLSTTLIERVTYFLKQNCLSIFGALLETVRNLFVEGLCYCDSNVWIVNDFQQNMVYYKISHVDHQITNPEQRIASDVPRFCSELSEIVQDDLTKAYVLGVGAAIRNFSPSFRKLMSKEKQLEGDRRDFEVEEPVQIFNTPLYEQDGSYPGTGKFDEVGSGDGEGTTLNLPLPGGSGDTTIRTVFDDIVHARGDVAFWLYRLAVEEVQEDDYMLPLFEANFFYEEVGFSCGARFDPYGPLGVPDFHPNIFT
ncbi:hypothetical protein CR513_40483, partial [Mucuna pruriens]